jgi:hypothetical protein
MHSKQSSLQAICGSKSSIDSMHAKLEEIKCISIDDLKHVWKIKAGSPDVVLCEGDEYIRVAPTCPSLVALVLENNDKAPAESTAWRSIKCSKGLASLTRLRSLEMAKLAADSQSSSASQQCTLFSDEAGSESTPPQTSKKRRVSFTKKEKLQERSSLEVTISVGDELHAVKLLKPTTASENIFALYEPACLGLVIRYLREQGFDEDVQRNACLPKGIRFRKHSKGNFYIVVYKKDDGSIGYKKCSDLDSAICFQANPVADGVCDAAEPDDPLADPLDDVCDDVEPGDSQVVGGEDSEPSPEGHES